MENIPSNTTNPANNEEISIREIIRQLRNWVVFLLGKWRPILLISILGAAIGLAASFFCKPKYNANLTFVLEDAKMSPLASYAGIASQFGLDLGSMGGSGIFTGDNIMEFLRSRFMVEKTLLSAVNHNAKEISLAELYVESEMKGLLSDKTILKGRRLPPNVRRESFSRFQDSVLHIIYSDILKKNLAVNKPDRKLSFISVECISHSEVFSKVFVERLVKEATDFYVATKTSRSKSSVDKLQAKADSIEALLNQKTYSAALQMDVNMNPARRITTVGGELASRDKLVLQTMYGEVLKNLELSKISMAQETPIIQIVDTPIYPLEKKKIGKVKGIVLGGIAAGFLVIIFIAFSRVIRLLREL